MFKFSLLTAAYDSTAELLKTVSENVIYAYGVIDTLGSLAAASFKTKKSTESDPVLTTKTSNPEVTPVANMGVDKGFVCMLTGTKGGSPALAYVIDDLAGTNSNVVNNLATIAGAMGYNDWFIAPQIHPNNESVGAGTCRVTEYKLQVGGGQSPYSVSVTGTDVNMPMFVLDVPAGYPCINTWLPTAEQRDALIDFIRGNEFHIAERGGRQGTNQRFLALTQRQYITDLENTQDVLRQAVLDNAAGVAKAIADISTESSIRLDADRALRSGIDNMSVFGNTFKKIVDTNTTIEQYIPRP